MFAGQRDPAVVAAGDGGDHDRRPTRRGRASFRIMARPLDDDGDPTTSMVSRAAAAGNSSPPICLRAGPSRKLMFVAHPYRSHTMPGVLTGLIPACHTPFDRGGRLDLSVVPRQAELFRESGMTAVFVAGTTGEWSSLTSRGADGPLRPMDRDGRGRPEGRGARRAQLPGRGGARWRPTRANRGRPPSRPWRRATSSRRRVADLVEFLIPIAAAADPLPFYYYEIPGMTGVRLSTSQLAPRGPVPHPQPPRAEVLALRPASSSRNA